jgi:hypothetical protein
MKLIKTMAILNLLFVMLYGNPPDSAEQIVQSEMKSERFLKRIKHFARATDAKVTDFSLGEPLKLYNILDSELYSWGESLVKINNIPPAWVFPIKENGRISFWIEVKFENNKWVDAGGGYTGIAPELDNIFSSWPGTGGYTPILIIAYKCGAYFHIPQISNTNLTRIEPTMGENGTLINFVINKQKYSTLSELTDFRKTYEKIFLKNVDNGEKK